MFDTKTVDPLKAWKEMYDQTEKYFGKVFSEAMKKDEYNAYMGSVLEMNLFYQKMMNELTKNYLNQANVPSKEDVAGVAQLVINLEEKVETVEELLENNFLATDSSKEMIALKRDVAKVRNEMKQLDSKLDLILDRLEEQTKKETESKAETDKE
ncbi:MAG: polyhydroxyalkanoic acid synthase subunit PhaR [Bacillaceae bacterium]